jgi:DNA-binding NtrC family response regulator
MARRLSTEDSLTKLLDESGRPIYVVDAQRRIVYCNEALAAWIDLPSKRIVGRRVEYHSEEPKSDDKARDDSSPLTDLCPPPHALAGESGTGTISCQARDGRMLHRAAEFVPLDSPASGKTKKKSREQDDGLRFAVLVLLAGEEMSPQEIAAGVSGEPSADELHRTIRRFRRGQASRCSIQSLLGASLAMQKVRAQVEAAVASGANTLIYGERGTGRGHVARAVHYRAANDETKFLPIDCELLTDELFERTLDRLRPSRAEGKQKPTLLLENLESMPAAQQSLLLAAIRQGAVDARILATINPRVQPVQLDEETTDDGATAASRQTERVQPRASRVAPELIAAVSTIAIRAPRLVDRLEDLPLLAQYFLESCNRSSSKQVGSIRRDALDLLALYSWPADLQQLRQTIAAAHRACASHEILPADLPPVFHQAFRAATHVRKQPERIVLDELLAEIEKEAIVRALARAGGNKSEAATLLGMTRPRLYRRLVQLGLVTEGADDGQPEAPEFIEHDATE